ncbi:MAG: beta-galactosidase, partial [Clostridia bacterium]|nr:beta-galactosidase [Clostridia bacterium]
MNKLTWDKQGFYLDGEPFRILSGDMHYFRIHPSDWGKRLDLAVDFGLNCIQTYVPWNAHEPRPGEYCFEGMLDLGEYLRLAGEKGLRVLLRPSPYICSEWDFGGLPSWLLPDREMVIRTHDEKYLAAVRRYYEHLIPVILPHLATHGGPVIAVATENEYGSYGNDHAYIKAMGDMMRELGVDVPFYTADGALPSFVAFGKHPEGFVGLDTRTRPDCSIHAAETAA